jgi:hypothetical protein
MGFFSGLPENSVPKVPSPNVPSANVGMPYGKTGNIIEEKKTHPRELPLHGQNM